MVESFLDDYNLLRQGEATVHAGDPEQSLRFYRQALELNPDNLRAHLRIAEAYLQLGRTEDAEQAYRRMAELLRSGRADREEKKKVLAARRAIADFYYRANRLPEAEKHLRAALELSPEDAELHQNLGLVHLMAGRLQEAEARFRQVARLDPGNGLAHLLLGLAVERSGRREEAREHYRAALQRRPRREEECFAVAQALLTKREFAAPLARYLREFLDDHPKCAHAYVLLGKLHLGQDNLDRALQAFEAAHRIDPGLTWVRAKIAELERRRGKRMEQARDDERRRGAGDAPDPGAGQ